MNEIKIRAWDKKEEKLKKVMVIDWDTKEVVFYDDEARFFKDIILMQYTGLKDNQDRDIYEGDILSSQGDIGVVVFKDGCFCLKYDEDDFFPLNKLNLSCDYCIDGNIYENPEVLNDSFYKDGGK